LAVSSPALDAWPVPLPEGDAEAVIYEVHAEGYAPLTAEQERFTGIVGPALTAQSTVTVPESGVVASLKLKKPAPSAERQTTAD